MYSVFSHRDRRFRYLLWSDFEHFSWKSHSTWINFYTLLVIIYWSEFKLRLAVSMGVFFNFFWLLSTFSWVVAPVLLIILLLLFWLVEASLLTDVTSAYAVRPSGSTRFLFDPSLTECSFLLSSLSLSREQTKILSSVGSFAVLLFCPAAVYCTLCLLLLCFSFWTLWLFLAKLVPCVEYTWFRTSASV